MSASENAIEQVLWWSQDGLSPRDALEAVEIYWPFEREPTRDDTALALRVAYRRMMRAEPREDTQLRLVFGGRTA